MHTVDDAQTVPTLKDVVALHGFPFVSRWVAWRVCP
jgi:hypothetical protein